MFEGNVQESVDFLIWQYRLEDHRPRDISEGDHRLTTDYRRARFLYLDGGRFVSPDWIDKIRRRIVCLHSIIID